MQRVTPARHRQGDDWHGQLIRRSRPNQPAWNGSGTAISVDRSFIKRYSGRVPDKEGTGFDDLQTKEPAKGPRKFHAAFFVLPLHASMAGLGRDTFGCAGFWFFVRFVNPVLCPPPFALVPAFPAKCLWLPFVNEGAFMTDTRRADQRNHATGDHDTCDQGGRNATHKAFRWTEGADNVVVDAAFLETTLDISAGINTCLEIVYASNLERLANADADEGDTAPPAVGIVEADHLMRMSIAAAALLRDDARRRVELSLVS